MSGIPIVPGGVGDTSVVGREAELEVLRRHVDEVLQRGSAVLVAGEAGIGKTTVVTATRAYASEQGLRVLVASGNETEAGLPYAALHQLLRPIVDRAGSLPAPQRDALLAAFGIEPGATFDLFLVALATLTLVADCAAECPVLLVAEDVQWFDRASLDVLGFLARRLEHDPIVMVAAARDGTGLDAGTIGLEELRLAALPDREAGDILDRVAPDLPSSLRSLVLDHAEGNPLALTELPHALAAGDSVVVGGEIDVIPLTTRLEQAFAARAARLPAPTKTLLLVAAANDRDDAREIILAASIVATGLAESTALDPALDAGLMRAVDARLEFRHPLVRSAVYQSAASNDRRVAHAALASVVGDPDRRVVHEAAAATGPDEQLADELELSARRAEGRGAPLVAVERLERAAAFTPGAEMRVERLLAAGDIAFEAGRPDFVERLIASARQERLTPLQAGRLEYLGEIFEDSRSGDPLRVRALVKHAREAARVGDSNLALRLLSGAALRSFWADPGEEARREVVAAAAEVPVDPMDPTLLLTLGCADPLGQAATVVERLSRLTDADFDRPASHLYGLAAQAVGDSQQVIRLVNLFVETLRRDGRLGALTHALTVMGTAAALAGDFEIARPALEEGLRLGWETEQPIWRAGPWANLAIVHAARGDCRSFSDCAGRAEEVALPRRLSTILCCVQIAKGIDALAGARHDDAYRELLRVFTPGDAAFNMRHLAGAISFFGDAASFTGRQAEAREVLDRLGLFALDRSAPALAMGLGYARVILAPADEMEALFEESCAMYTVGWSFDHARLLLAQGVWLRRQRRVADSRAPLRRARDLFDQIGAAPWSQFARQELRAAGEGSPARAEASWDRLSAQELQIARLAAEGLSNREIGARLYLSHRTVASHLYRAFPKLGISSRAQLVHALREPVDASVAP